MKASFLALVLIIPAAAQVVPDQYIVELSADPVARVSVRRGVSRSNADLSAQRTLIREQQRKVRAAAEANGAEVLDSVETVHNAVVVRASRDRVARLRQIEGVKSVRPVRLYYPTLDYSLPLQKVNEVWNLTGGPQKAGLGIKIGIIDTGIATNHAAFQDPDLKAPEGFPKVNAETDLQYTNGKVIVARAYTNPSTRRPYAADDAQGHGTAVAMVAAGVTTKAPRGTITGVAPKAWLGSYKVFPTTTGGAPTSIVLRGLEDAVNDGMDVINLSLGSFPAGRPEDDDLVIAIENAVAAGKVVVVASGNTGSGLNTLASPGVAPSAITVGSSANGRVFAAKVSTDESEMAAFPGDSTQPARPISALLKDVEEFDSTRLACAGLPAGSLTGRIAVIMRGSCSFGAKLASAEAAGAVAAVIYSFPEEPAALQNITVSGAPLPMVAISNSDGEKLRGLAARGLTGTIDFTTGPVVVNSAVLSSFSGRGPSSDFRVKPDLLAIGQTIYTARPPLDGTDRYDVLSGTSFSAPTVAGAVALLMSVRPGLTAEQYRSLIVNSSGEFSVDGGAHNLGSQYAGTGLLNLASSLSGVVTASPVSISYGKGYPSVDEWRVFKITNVGTATDTFSITAHTSSEGPLPIVHLNTFELAPGQSADVPVKFAAENLTPGIYEGILRVTGTLSSATARVPYWFGIPSQRPSAIQVFSPPETGRRDSDVRIYFRVNDENGLPVFDGITQSMIKLSSGQIAGFDYNDFDVPGSWMVTVRTPSNTGALTVGFEVGSVVREIVIAVN